MQLAFIRIEFINNDIKEEDITSFMSAKDGVSNMISQPKEKIDSYKYRDKI